MNTSEQTPSQPVNTMFGPETVRIVAEATVAGLICGMAAKAVDQVTALCQQIEKCGASEELTRATVMAGELKTELEALKKCLNVDDAAKAVQALNSVPAAATSAAPHTDDIGTL